MHSPTLANRLRLVRNQLAKRYIKRRLLRRDYSLISDDCWAGRLYAELGLRCLSPFVGMGFTPTQYLDFITHLWEPGALDPLSVSSEERGYPIIQTRHARLHGLHYETDDEFLKTYERRRRLLLPDRIFIKIDLGKAKYRPEDIERWNTLRLPRSVALYPDTPHYRALNIHNGIAVPDWEADGGRQYQLSTRRFDIFSWLNHDQIQLTPGYRIAQLLLLEKFFLPRVRRLLCLNRRS